MSSRFHRLLIYDVKWTTKINGMGPFKIYLIKIINVKLFSLVIFIFAVGTLSWLLHDLDWYRGLASLLPPGRYPDSTRFPGGANRVSSARPERPGIYQYNIYIIVFVLVLIKYAFKLAGDLTDILNRFCTIIKIINTLQPYE